MAKFILIMAIVLGAAIVIFEPIALYVELTQHLSPLAPAMQVAMRGLMAIAGAGLIVIGVRRVRSL